MTRDDAIATCQRWLDHVQESERRSFEMQRLACRRREGMTKCEAERKLRELDAQPSVFDGAELVRAVRTLITS